MNKILLWFTGIVMFGFLITFPTRDRRVMVDRIRLQVGAKNLVSKQTLKLVAAEEKAAAKKAGRKIASANDKFDHSNADSPLDRQDRLNKNVAFYCNQEFNRQACTQWLTYCGESCRMLVNPATWTAMTTVRKPATAQAKARRPAAAPRKTTVASAKTRR